MLAHIRAAERLGKPLLVSAFGKQRHGSTSYMDHRNALFKMVLEETARAPIVAGMLSCIEYHSPTTACSRLSDPKTVAINRICLVLLLLRISEGRYKEDCFVLMLCINHVCCQFPPYN